MAKSLLEELFEKAKQAAQGAATKVKQTVQSIPKNLQTASEKYIPGGIQGGVNRVKQMNKSDAFIFSPRTLNANANMAQMFTQKSKSPVVRAGGSAYSELLRGKAKGSQNVATGVRKAFTGENWFDKLKGAGQAAAGAFQFAQPDIAVATGPARAATAAVLGGGINAAISKFQGKDVATGFGKGATEGTRMAAVTKFTDPVISKAASVFAPEAGFLAKQIATRGITGIGNVIEDEILAKLDEQKPENADRAISLAIGMALGGNDELFDQAKRQIKSFLGNGPITNEQVAKVTKQVVDRLRDEGGRFAKEATTRGPKTAQEIIDSIKVDFVPKADGTGMVRTENGKVWQPETVKAPSSMRFSADPENPNRMIRAELAQSRLRPNQESMMGAVAGLEPELDENGKPTGKFKYNPVTGLGGMFAMGAMKKQGVKNAVKAADDIKLESKPGINEWFKNERIAREGLQGLDVTFNTMKDSAGKQIGSTDFSLRTTKDGEKIANISVFGIDDAFQGKGYGKKLLESMEQKAKEAGAKTMEITSITNPEFWKHMGFENAGKDKMVKDLSIKPKTAEEIVSAVRQKGSPKIEPQSAKSGQTMEKFFGGNKAPNTEVQAKPELPVKSTSELNISRKTTQASPLNVNRLDLTDEQKGRVAASQIKEVRDILSDKEITEIAKKAGIDTKTNNIDQTAEKIAGQLNVRRQVVELENARTKMLQEGATPQELEDITAQIQAVSRISREQGTDIARQLSARRIIANEINTPMQRVFQLLDKAGVNPETYTKDAAALDFNDGNAVVDFYRKYVPPQAEDWLTLVRYNSMLSSPNTQINNFFSNLQGSLLVAPIEKEIAAGIDALKSALTGNPREYISGEGVAYAKGYIQSVGKAVKSFADTMSGKTMSANLDYREIPLTQSGSRFRKTENVLKFPMKLLESFDQFFTTLTKGGVQEELAYKAGKGVNVKDPVALADAEAAKRLFRSDLGDNEGSTVLNALDVIANMVQGLKSNDNVIVRNVARFSLPFLRTPTNLLKQGLEYSPLGVATMIGAKDKTEQLAKAVFGSSIGLGVATMVASDRITWAEPTSQKQKNAFRAAGLQPYSIKVGDKWVSYSKMHPAIAFPIALVAAVKDAEENGNLDETQGDQILAGLSSWTQFFADQSYVKSIGDLVAGVKGDVDRKTQMAANYATQLVPFRALMGWVARLVDPYQRQVDPDGGALEKQFDYLKTQIPLLSMTVPAREDQFGQPIENQNRAVNAFSPFKITIEKPEQKQEYDWIKEQAQMDKEERQFKEKLDKEAQSSITVPQANASESTMIEGQGMRSGGELTKQEKKRVKTLLEYGKDVDENSLVSYYLGDVKGSAEDTGYKATMRRQDLMKKYEAVEADENLSSDQKEVVQNAILEETGIQPEKIDYWRMSKLDNSLKYEKATEDIQAFTTHEEVIDYLANGRELVMGQMFSTPGVIDSFYEDGLITKAEVKYLKALKWDEKTRDFKLDRDYKSSGSSAKSKLAKEKETALKALFSKAADLPKIGGSYQAPASQVDWSNTAPKGSSEPVSPKFSTKAPQVPALTMENFFKPKKTGVSAKAYEAVAAVRGGGNKDERLKLRYAGGPK